MVPCCRLGMVLHSKQFNKLEKSIEKLKLSEDCGLQLLITTGLFQNSLNTAHDSMLKL